MEWDLVCYSNVGCGIIKDLILNNFDSGSCTFGLPHDLPDEFDDTKYRAKFYTKLWIRTSRKKNMIDVIIPHAIS